MGSLLPARSPVDRGGLHTRIEVVMLGEIAGTRLAAGHQCWCRPWHPCLVFAAFLIAAPAKSQNALAPPATTTAPDPFDLSRVPARPTLPTTDSDTNSALAYQRLGFAILDTTHSPDGP